MRGRRCRSRFRVLPVRPRCGPPSGSLRERKSSARSAARFSPLRQKGIPTRRRRGNPSRALVYAGMISALFCFVMFAYCVWPWIFPLEEGEFLVDYEAVLKENKVPTDRIPKTAKAAADDKNFKKMLDDAEDKEKTQRI